MPGLNDGNNIKGDGSHVEQHNGDVKQGGEEENPLALKEYRE